MRMGTVSVLVILAQLAGLTERLAWSQSEELPIETMLDGVVTLVRSSSTFPDYVNRALPESASASRTALLHFWAEHGKFALPSIKREGRAVVFRIGQDEARFVPIDLDKGEWEVDGRKITFSAGK